MLSDRGGSSDQLTAADPRGSELSRRRISLGLAGSCVLAVLLATGVAGADSPQRSIGFSKLTVRGDGAEPVLAADVDFRALILEELQNQGFATVGAESVVSGGERAETAELRLAGTAHGLECRNMLEKGGACRLSVDWELLDVRSMTTARTGACVCIGMAAGNAAMRTTASTIGIARTSARASPTRARPWSARSRASRSAPPTCARAARA